MLCFKSFCHMPSELKLGRVFATVHLVNKNAAEEGIEVLLSRKELIELRDDSPNILEKSNINLLIGILLDRMPYLLVEGIVV